MPLNPVSLNAALESGGAMAFVSLLVESGHKLVSYEVTPDVVPVERYERVENGPDQGQIRIIRGETPSGQFHYTLHFSAPFVPPQVDDDSLRAAVAADDKFPLTEEAKRRAEDEVRDWFGLSRSTPLPTPLGFLNENES